MGKKEELMAFLHENIFDPILKSKNSSVILKQGVKLTISRMNSKDAEGIIRQYVNSFIGEEKPTKFAEMMKAQGFTRFEEVNDEFHERFNEGWLKN